MVTIGRLPLIGALTLVAVASAAAAEANAQVGATLLPPLLVSSQNSSLPVQNISDQVHFCRQTRQTATIDGQPPTVEIIFDYL